MMNTLLGFDPGGKGRFGWCVTEDAANRPLHVRAMGLADNAQCAVDRALAHVGHAEQVKAVGIDAPLFWIANDGRKVDRTVRDRLRILGAKSPGGTVQTVNSLRGACLIQGILTAILLRESRPEILITESHPKAILWLLRLANPERDPTEVSLLLMDQFFETPPEEAADHDHRRDAAIAALCAWAMVHRPQDWQDLYAEEYRSYSPIATPLGYWIPRGDD